MSEPHGRGAAWTGARDERRGKAAPQKRPEASEADDSTSDEGRRRLTAPRRRAMDTR